MQLHTFGGFCGAHALHGQVYLGYIGYVPMHVLSSASTPLATGFVQQGVCRGVPVAPIYILGLYLVVLVGFIYPWTSIYPVNHQIHKCLQSFNH